MSKFYVYPYKQGSKSAKELANTLGGKVLKLEGSKFNPGPGKIIINWGNSSVPQKYISSSVLNVPDSVRIASNKLLTFQELKKYNVSIPEFEINKSQVIEKVKAGETWCIRQKLTGHSGQGMSVASKPEEVLDAPLYVKYIKKETELRIHIGHEGQLIDYQEKRKVKGWKENPNYSAQIRHLQTGWVYCRDNVTKSDAAIQLAHSAIKALSLDFGAVDIIYNGHQNAYYVLEVNTAPGLVGTTLENYSTFFKGL